MNQIIKYNESIMTDSTTITKDNNLSNIMSISSAIALSLSIISCTFSDDKEYTQKTKKYQTYTNLELSSINHFNYLAVNDEIDFDIEFIDYYMKPVIKSEYKIKVKSIKKEKFIPQSF